jgi:hypothetical protein
LVQAGPEAARSAARKPIPRRVDKKVESGPKIVTDEAKSKSRQSAAPVRERLRSDDLRALTEPKSQTFRFT